MPPVISASGISRLAAQCFAIASVSGRGYGGYGTGRGGAGAVPAAETTARVRRADTEDTAALRGAPGVRKRHNLSFELSHPTTSAR